MVIPVKDVQSAIDHVWGVSEHGAKPDMNEVKSLRVRRGIERPFSANKSRVPELAYDPQTNLFLASARTFKINSEIAKVRHNGNMFVDMPPIPVGTEIGVT
jgi:hypothetical protein